MDLAEDTFPNLRRFVCILFTVSLKMFKAKVVKFFFIQVGQTVPGPDEVCHSKIHTYVVKEYFKIFQKAALIDIGQAIIMEI